jgi:transposase-like protein
MTHPSLADDDPPPCPCCGLTDRVRFQGASGRPGERVSEYVCVPCSRAFTEDESERAAEVRRS